MSVAYPIAPTMMRLVTGSLIAMFILFGQMVRADISGFVGEFSGSAEIVSADGTSMQRDMSVEIVKQSKGFSVSWTSTTYKPDGRIKEKSYSIDFVPSDRPDIYAAAQAKDVFGHLVQLDPMKGEPFVWARIIGETLTVFSLFVNDDGGYEMQQFDRTLVKGGLHLDFMRIRNGKPQKSVSTLLVRK